MSDVKVKLKLRGINALMTSQPVTAEIVRRVKRGAQQAGPGFEGVMRPTRFTARGYVRTADASGAAREAREKVLIRVLDAMR